MEFTQTITTTTASSTNWWVSGTGTDWFIVNDSDSTDNPNNALETIRFEFKKASDKFFMDHETEYYHNERLDRYYDRKADNEAIAALMS